MTDPITRLNATLAGRYRVERELGEGGMATVYLAHDERHNRNVALKVLKAELAAVVGAERFLAEIETTAKLTHPHILPLFDSGEADGFLYFVTPYIEGDTLRDKIDREKQLSIEEALKITSDIAEALDHAHRHGVVHRDIKPANVLLTDGRPLIADFGIALAVAQAGGGRITETGLSVGTPHYMSPEQATGDRDVDPRTDVYALGCVLYEMLVGEPPYSGTTAQAVLAKILTDPAPAPTKVRVSIPPNVDAAIRKALEKLPADRFTSAQDFQKALTDSGFRHGDETAEGVVASIGIWRPWAMASTGLAVIFAIGFGWLLFQPEPLPTPASRQVMSTEGWADLGTEFGRSVALAPDGSSMILPVGGQLGLKMRGSTEITSIADTEGAREVIYSPDAQWIAYSVGAELFKRPVVGGSAVGLAEDLPATPGILALGWLDDGTILYEQGGQESRRLVRISENGGEPLEAILGDEEELRISWVEGLPGARGALVTACPVVTTCLGGQTQLLIVNLEDLSSEMVSEQVLRGWYAPTGHIVYTRSDGAVFAQPFDLAVLETTGSAFPLFAGVRTTVRSNSASADMWLAADGTLLYLEGGVFGAGTSAGRERFVIADLEGSEEALPLPARAIGGASWAPDGESVAYWGGDVNIYTHDILLGATPRQLTFEGTNAFPVFSPNGSSVAFASERDGTDGFDLFVKTLDDDAPARSLIALPGAQIPSHWARDNLIVFESIGAGPADIWALDLSDPDSPSAEEYLLSEARLRRARISPDGTLAAYQSNESGIDQVYIRSFPEPRERTLVSQDEGFFPFWATDGNTLYYWINEGSGV